MPLAILVIYKRSDFFQNKFHRENVQNSDNNSSLDNLWIYAKFLRLYDADTYTRFI